MSKRPLNVDRHGDALEHIIRAIGCLAAESEKSRLSRAVSLLVEVADIVEEQLWRHDRTKYLEWLDVADAAVAPAKHRSVVAKRARRWKARLWRKNSMTFTPEDLHAGRVKETATPSKSKPPRKPHGSGSKTETR